MVNNRNDLAPFRPPLGDLTLGDLQAVRNILEGGSVIDWQRLDFKDHDEVDRFLRVNEFNPGDRADIERLEELRAEAVEYLRQNFNLRIPDAIAEKTPVRDLFLIASRATQGQTYACVVLKVMHIVHHLAGRELLFRLPISDDEVFALVERKVVHIVEELRAVGHQIPQFEWSRKPRDSLITKLLAKRSVLAANVYDKLRFRLVVKEQQGILPLLVELSHRLIPFNYIVPEESVNDILRLEDAVTEMPAAAPVVGDFVAESSIPDLEARLSGQGPVPRGANEFSGPTYQIINFIADLPLRLDTTVKNDGGAFEEFGPIAFALTEFQVVDEVTSRTNESGENSHEKYKERQRAQVRRRLMTGLRGVDRPGSAPPGEGHGGGGNGH